MDDEGPKVAQNSDQTPGPVTEKGLPPTGGDPGAGDPFREGLDFTGNKKVRDLFVWKSFNRPQKQYSREVFSTLGAIALLVSIILAFFQEWLAILVTWTAFFLFWQLTKVDPVEVDHKITTEGIVSMNHAYLWSELGPFWFTQKENEDILHVAHYNIFGQLILLINKEDQEKVRNVLAEYLPYIEVPEKSPVEKFSDWFAKKFPLESKKPHVEAPTPPAV